MRKEVLSKKKNIYIYIPSETIGKYFFSYINVSIQTFRIEVCNTFALSAGTMFSRSFLFFYFALNKDLFHGFIF